MPCGLGEQGPADRGSGTRTGRSGVVWGTQGAAGSCCGGTGAEGGAWVRRGRRAQALRWRCGAEGRGGGGLGGRPGPHGRGRLRRQDQRDTGCGRERGRGCEGRRGGTQEAAGLSSDARRGRGRGLECRGRQTGCGQARHRGLGLRCPRGTPARRRRVALSARCTLRPIPVGLHLRNAHGAAALSAPQSMPSRSRGRVFRCLLEHGL